MQLGNDLETNCALHAAFISRLTISSAVQTVRAGVLGLTTFVALQEYFLMALSQPRTEVESSSSDEEGEVRRSPPTIHRRQQLPGQRSPVSITSYNLRAAAISCWLLTWLSRTLIRSAFQVNQCAS